MMNKLLIIILAFLFYSKLDCMARSNLKLEVISKQFYGYVYRNEGVCRIYNVKFKMSGTNKAPQPMLVYGDLSDEFIEKSGYYFLNNQRLRNRKDTVYFSSNSSFIFSKYVCISNTKTSPINFEYVFMTPNDFLNEDFKFIIEYELAKTIFRMKRSKSNTSLMKIDSEEKRAISYNAILQHKKDFYIDVLSCSVEF
jgi:hypothetical protein